MPIRWYFEFEDGKALLITSLTRVTNFIEVPDLSRRTTPMTSYAMSSVNCEQMAL